MLDFKYKIFDIEDYLTKEEFKRYEDLIHNLNFNMSTVESSVGFLFWSPIIESLFKENCKSDYERIMKKGKINYQDYLLLSEFNKKNSHLNLHEHYFNFMLCATLHEFNDTETHSYISKAYSNLIHDLFGKVVKDEYKDMIFKGNVNVYPKHSFIKKHVDNDPEKRIFTALFYLNHDWKKEYGSITRFFEEDQIVEFIPDYRKIVIIETMKNNVYHDVTENISDKIRLSLYRPFNLSHYENGLI